LTLPPPVSFLWGRVSDRSWGRVSDRFPPLFIIMARRYVKRRPLAKRNKYSVEQTTYSLAVLRSLLENVIILHRRPPSQ